MVFRIGHREDIAKAERILRAIVEKQDQILDEPKPVIKIDELGEWSIDFIVRPWARTEDYWDVYHAVTRMVKERFDAEGIPLPYPQRSVHLHQEAAILEG
jgi:small conductance mechanosensitive channel